MSRRKHIPEDAGKRIVAHIAKAKDGVHHEDACKFVVSLGYKAIGAASILSALVKTKKLKRFRDANGAMFFYTRGNRVPEGCVDLGYKLLRIVKPKPEAIRIPIPGRGRNKVSQPVGASVLLTVQWGANRSESVTLAEGREIFDQLKTVFH